MLAQVAEIERLAGDNHRLAATHGALRQELVAVQHEISRINMHHEREGNYTKLSLKNNAHQIRVELDFLLKIEDVILE